MIFMFFFFVFFCFLLNWKHVRVESSLLQSLQLTRWLWIELFSTSYIYELHAYIFLTLYWSYLLHIGDGHSIYVKNLPLSVTPNQLEMEFKRFGPIKHGGVQVRSNKVILTHWTCMLFSATWSSCSVHAYFLLATGISLWLCGISRCEFYEQCNSGVFYNNPFYRRKIQKRYDVFCWYLKGCFKLPRFALCGRAIDFWYDKGILSQHVCHLRPYTVELIDSVLKKATQGQV